MSPELQTVDQVGWNHGRPRFFEPGLAEPGFVAQKL